MKSVQRVRVLGAPVDAVDMAGALGFVENRIRGRQSQPSSCVVAINPEKAFAARKNPELHTCLEDAALVIPDGIGVVLAARLLHRVPIRRVAGADLMQEICRRAAEKGYRLFLYGASEEVNRSAVAELRRRFPDISIVGRQHGFLPPDAMDKLLDEIDQSQADILFVALGSPRQENWMKCYAPRLNTPVCMGIGGTLDTLVGHVKRAPRIWQRLGLEWLYRLISQPSRAKRQIVLPLFVWLVVRDILRTART